MLFAFAVFTAAGTAAFVAGSDALRSVSGTTSAMAGGFDGAAPALASIWRVGRVVSAIVDRILETTGRLAQAEHEE